MNGPIFGFSRRFSFRCSGGSGYPRIFWIVLKFRLYFLQASRLLMPPTSTSRRILVHLSMSVITHFPRDPEHWVTHIDRTIEAPY